MREASTPTRRSIPVPSTMLVGIPEGLADAVKEQLDPIPVIRVGHLAAASERITLTRPLVVVVGELGAGRGDLVPFRELARGCGTEVVQLDELGPIDEVPRQIEQMVITYSRRRSGQFVAVEMRKTPPHRR